MRPGAPFCTNLVRSLDARSGSWHRRCGHIDYDVGRKRNGGERAVRRSASGEVSERQVEKVVHAVRQHIVDVHRALPEEFRPAHLSVALIDAVFNPRLHYASVVVPIVERYCDHFGFVRTVAPGEWPPPLSAQEALCDLIGAYDALGGEFLRTKVFRSRHFSPGTRVYKTDNVLHCAHTLRAIGLNTLQDAQGKEPGSIKHALCAVHRDWRGHCAHAAHVLRKR